MNGISFGPSLRLLEVVRASFEELWLTWLLVEMVPLALDVSDIGARPVKTKWTGQAKICRKSVH